ncbi:MAG TPA: VirB3 family type IV secretion system protein [Longimicrobium sp.]|nr:VirB3 family type IV secretion system protein [Longimicrobium sp.]
MSTRQRRGHAIHPSLVRNPLLFGTESEAVVGEALVVWGVVVFAGLSVLTLAVAVAFWIVVHPLLVWVSKRDAQVFRLYLRSLSHQSYYPAHALLRAPAPAFHNAFPGRRA